MYVAPFFLRYAHGYNRGSVSLCMLIVGLSRSAWEGVLSFFLDGAGFLVAVLAAVIRCVFLRLPVPL